MFLVSYLIPRRKSMNMKRQHDSKCKKHETMAPYSQLNKMIMSRTLLTSCLQISGDLTTP